MNASKDSIAVSVVVPCKNEEGNLSFLVDEIGTALSGRQFEVIVVNDGSTDDTVTMLAEMQSSRPWLRHICHQFSCGQSASVRTGVLHARGDVIVTIDGDGQNNPKYIPDLVDALENAGPATAMAGGQRVGRKASFSKRMASRFANWLRGSLLKDQTRDSGCGLKAIRREVFLQLPYFDAWHRFMAALIVREGYKLVFVDVVDRDRQHGHSKYGVLDRALIGLPDLIGVAWLCRRRRRIPVVSESNARDEGSSK